MAKLNRTTETVVKTAYTLTLTEFEAQCLKTLLGKTSGFGLAATAIGDVWRPLHEEGVADAPLAIDEKMACLYIKDKG